MARKKSKMKAKTQEGGQEDGNQDANENAEAASSGGSKLGKIIIVVVAAVVIIGGGAGAAFFFMGDTSAPATQTAQTEEDGTKTVTVVDDGTNQDEGGANKTAQSKALYYEIKPPFVIQIKSKKYQKIYLQVGITVMSRNQMVIDEVQQHTPLIKNDLNAIFADKYQDELMTIENKNELRKECVETINAILHEHGSGHKIENVLFTSFMVQ